mgnify:CR=1 FL=1
MARSTLDFFLSLGIPVLEVYGMSECTGPTTFSTENRYRIGSSGWAIPGTELKIAEDGEILYRGPHVFVGYFKNPEATREAWWRGTTRQWPFMAADLGVAVVGGMFFSTGLTFFIVPAAYVVILGDGEVMSKVRGDDGIAAQTLLLGAACHQV